MPGRNSGISGGVRTTVAEEDLRIQMQFGMKDKKLKNFWNKYTILLDGNPLQRPDRYPRCTL